MRRTLQRTVAAALLADRRHLAGHVRSHAHAFVTLHLTRKGQEIIESIGFVPTTTY